MAVLHANRLLVALMVIASTSHASQVEVVLAHHSEDLTWLSHIPGNVGMHVYTKGPEMHYESVCTEFHICHRKRANTDLSHLSKTYTARKQENT